MNKKNMIYGIFAMLLILTMVSIAFAADVTIPTNPGLSTTEKASLNTLLAPFWKAIWIVIALASVVLVIGLIKFGFDLYKFGDNEEERKKAIQKIMWTIIGYVLIVSAPFIAAFVISIFG